MNEAHDSLEAELAALRPRDVSPGLQRRIAERLADASPSKTRRLWVFAFAGGLAAACLAAALLGWGSGRRIETEQIVIQPQPAPSVQVQDSGPSVQAYWFALARSPDELDVLLDKHAVVAPDPNPQLVRSCAFTRFDATLHTLLGED